MKIEINLRGNGLYHQVMELLRRYGGINGREIARRLKKGEAWVRGYLYALQELGLVKARRIGSAIFYYPIDREEKQGGERRW